MKRAKQVFLLVKVKGFVISLSLFVRLDGRGHAIVTSRPSVNCSLPLSDWTERRQRLATKSADVSN